MLVTGVHSTIIKELAKLVPDELIMGVSSRFGELNLDLIPTEETHYVLCAGVIRPKRALSQTEDEIYDSLHANLIAPLLIAEHVLSRNVNARIAIMSSYSADKGSFDQIYAAAKAGLNQYIETKKLKPGQQLVGIAPTIIEDSNMTQARNDLLLAKQRAETEWPKRRMLKAVEVARMIYHLLYVDTGYTTNTVIRMHGGQGACS